MFKKRAISLLVFFLNPSAMLAGMETAARRICEVSPYNSLSGKFYSNEYIDKKIMCFLAL